jgi:AraC family transcriptional regulator
MDPVRKALWFVEGRFAADTSLDMVAAACGVSRFHLAHAFAIATGQPLARYMRGRRLTEAAKALANGAPGILEVALEVGYGSHEAFTRAFREQFGITPEALRADPRLETLTLVEAIMMDHSLLDDLAPPVFAEGKPLLIAGLGDRFDMETKKNIPALWQRLGPHLGHVPGQVRERGVTFGVSYNMDESGNFDYLAGVEVKDFAALPAEFTRIRLAPQRYAVFTHNDHVSSIGRVHMTIWRKWLPESEFQAADAPNFERYGEEFDGRTGLGGFQIWVPIKG